jgi:hypothetical protein
MDMMIRLVAIAFLVLGTAGCGGGDAVEKRRLWFVDGYVAELGMRGKLSHVDRTPAGADAPSRALGELLKGPTREERARGLISALPPTSRVESFSLANGTATVRLLGRVPKSGDFYASAQVVYTLTEFPEVSRVRLFVDGNSCCVYLRTGRPLRVLERRHFRGWQGDPLPPPDAE